MKSILYDWGGFNVWLFHRINNIRGSLIDPLMQLGTQLGSHQLFWLYVTLIILARLRQSELRDSQRIQFTEQQSSAWLVVIATLILTYFIEAWLVGALKQMFNFPRPPLALAPETMHLLTHKSDMHHSLPSGHAIFAATLVASLWPVTRPRFRIFLVLFVMWVGVSRINLGIHFPADVVYGAIIGVSLILIVRRLLWLFIKDPHLAT